MKIAMIGHKRIPSREGGVEIVVEELSTRMAQLGNDVTVYNRGSHHIAGEEYDVFTGNEYKGVQIKTIATPDRKSLNALVYAIKATIAALIAHYDVIHFHAEGPCIMIWLPHLFGIRTVATIHGLDWQRAKWGGFATWFLKQGEKCAAKYAGEIIVLSNNVQKYFQETYQRQTHLIPNGINPVDKTACNQIDQKYGLAENGYVLYLGRIVPEKGIHYLIEAFMQVETKKKLVIAGGSSHSEEYFNQLKGMAEKDERVIFTDFVQGQVLEELYSNCYLYILPSDIEGMAISLLEAMSYGTCCLVSDIDENVEVVKDHAFSFKHSNVQDLADKLRELLADTEKVSIMRENSKKYIMSEHNWDDVVKQTLTLYKKA